MILQNINLRRKNKNRGIILDRIISNKNIICSGLLINNLSSINNIGYMVAGFTKTRRRFWL